MPKSLIFLVAFGLLPVSFLGWSSPLEAIEAPASLCPSDVENLERWREVRKSVQEVDGNDLALDLADCLSSKDSELRDRIGYEVLTYWLRKDKLNPSTVEALRVKLIPWLSKGAGRANTDDAIARAFSALILSELVRYDSIHQQWAPKDITATLAGTLDMFRKERDYRGLDPELGWIHCVAHGSDLLWRLALHPKTSSEQHGKILEVLSSQIRRLGLPAYTHNEGDRLARVVGAISDQGRLPAPQISEWIATLGQPGELETWGAAFSSPEGMAQLHNVKQFLRALRHEKTLKEDLKRVVDTALAPLP